MTEFGYVRPPQADQPGYFTEADVRRVNRLPDQMLRALQRVQQYQVRYKQYGMSLEKEAQKLLHEIYGPLAPGFHAEEEYQRARNG